MSSDTTERLIRAYLNAFNAGDHDAMLGLLDDDVAHDINEGGREIGVEKFRWFLAMMGRHYRETLSDIEVMVNGSGTRAAAEFTVHGTYLATADGLPPANWADRRQWWPTSLRPPREESGPRPAW